MDVLQVNFKAPNAAEQFTKSLRQTGFGVIKNHPISQQLVEQVYQDWAEFFADKSKFDYRFAESHQDGFFPSDVAEVAKGNDIKDIKEFFQIYPWGKYPNNIGPASRQLFKEMSALAATLLGWIEDNTPPEIAKLYSMPLCEMIADSPKTMLRVLHYPPFQGNEPVGAVRAAAHEDINLITLLPAATENGLQVQDVNDNWHNVPCDYGMIAINVGDMLQMASDYYYPSTTHRVVNPGNGISNESRMSLPLFLHPRDDVRLSSTHTAGEYLNERLLELGLVNPDIA